MIKATHVALAVWLLSACGSSKADNMSVDMESTIHSKYTMDDHDEQFDQYLTGFPGLSGTVPVVLAPLGSKAGVCYHDYWGRREIEINQDSWKKYTPKEKRWIVWHEMTHCDLDIHGHNNEHLMPDGSICDEDKDIEMERYRCNKGIPLSIMRWYMPYDDQIDKVCASPGIDAITKVFCQHL